MSVSADEAGDSHPDVSHGESLLLVVLCANESASRLPSSAHNSGEERPSSPAAPSIGVRAGSRSRRDRVPTPAAARARMRHRGLAAAVGPRGTTTCCTHRLVSMVATVLAGGACLCFPRLGSHCATMTFDDAAGLVPWGWKEQEQGDPMCRCAFRLPLAPCPAISGLEHRGARWRCCCAQRC